MMTKSKHPLFKAIILCGCFLSVGTGVRAAGQSEMVEGNGCYSYGDQETPQQGAQKAMIQARRMAVENYRVFVKSESKIKNFQLEEDIILEASSGMLSHVRIEKREEKGRKLCLTISAQIDPEPMEALIDQRIKARKIVNQAQAAEVTPDSAFGLRVWLNKSDGEYYAEDNLVIFVESERDGYLKLDYFTADGKVVHLVPNMFRGQAKIQRGIKYAFGGEDSPESFMIQGPFGHEIIRAMVSQQPIANTLMPNSMVTESQTYLKTLKVKLRSIRVQANASAKLVTASKNVKNMKTIIQ